MMFIFQCFVLIYGVSSQITHYNAPEQDFETWEKEIANLPFEKLNRVLVCLNDESKSQLGVREDLRPKSDLALSSIISSEFHNFNFEYHDISTCDTEITNDDSSQTKTITAVVTPTPSKLSISKIPMYFYDTPHLYDDLADAFPNGFAPHQNHWKLLIHAFAHHIKRNNWRRIAVVSDNSWRSQVFERELEGHMKEMGIVYSLQRCVEKGHNCNFDRAMQFLSKHGSIIIISNVESHNSGSLANSARMNRLTVTNNLWLVRDWPFTDKPFTYATSLTLTPKLASKHTEGRPQLNSIWHGLNLISQAVESVDQNLDHMNGSVENYYSAIGIKIRTEGTPMAIIRDYGHGHHGQPRVLDSLTIQESGVVQSKNPKDGPVFQDWKEYCLLRSNSYTDPCNDVWAVLILIVWMVFVLILFLFTFFFTRCNTSHVW